MKITIKKESYANGKVYFWAYKDDFIVSNTCTYKDDNNRPDEYYINECIEKAKFYLTSPRQQVVKEVEI